jgi:CrcB protein
LASVEPAPARLSAGQLGTIAILAGGAAGTLARAGLLEAFPVRAAGWPWATFVANLAGALFLGWLVAWVGGRVTPTRYLLPLLGTGFAGALTTFSAFEIETIRLAKEGHAVLAVAYPTVSIALGMLCAVVGTLAGRQGRDR